MPYYTVFLCFLLFFLCFSVYFLILFLYFYFVFTFLSFFLTYFCLVYIPLLSVLPSSFSFPILHFFSLSLSQFLSFVIIFLFVFCFFLRLPSNFISAVILLPFWCVMYFSKKLFHFLLVSFRLFQFYFNKWIFFFYLFSSSFFFSFIFWFLASFFSSVLNIYSFLLCLFNFLFRFFSFLVNRFPFSSLQLFLLLIPQSLRLFVFLRLHGHIHIWTKLHSVEDIHNNNIHQSRMSVNAITFTKYENANYLLL